MALLVTPIQELKAVAIGEAAILHGREVVPYIPPALKDQIAEGLVKAGAVKSKDEAIAILDDDDGRTSLSTNDAYNSVIQHEIEKYDKEMDLMVLRSDAIVESYNQLINAKFDEAMKTYKSKISKWSQLNYEEKDKPLINTLETMAGMYDQYSQLPGVDADELKKTIISGYFFTSDDPEAIKRHVQFRVNYNKTIITMFQQMLQQNYQILGFSKDEALLLSQELVSGDQDKEQASVKQIKNAILQNKSKFDRGKGFIDLREIGGGVIFGTTTKTGLDRFVSIDRMVQTSLRYDCIIFGHGGSFSKEYADANRESKIATDAFEDAQKDFAETYKDYMHQAEAYFKKIGDAIKKNPNYESMVKSDRDKIIESYREYKDRMSKRLGTLREYQRVSFSEYMRYSKKAENTSDEKLMKQFEKDTEKSLDEYKAITDKIEKLGKELQAMSKKYEDMIEHASENSAYSKLIMKTIPDGFEDATKKLEELERDSAKMKDRLEEYGTRETEGSNGKPIWTIQPVYTEKAGPFTDMNELVRQVIKEGYKKIMIVSCNPGHHELDPDIKKTKGVIINHSMNTLLAETVMAPIYDENFDFDDPIDMAEQALYETEQHLIESATEAGINYWDDDFLNESITDMMSMEWNESLTEAGTARKIWTTIKELIKKALAFIVGLFKKIVEFFRRIIDKIKQFFQKIFGKDSKLQKPLRKKFKANFIIVESATAKSVDIGSWDDLQKNATSACERIANKIKKTEREQVDNMKKLQELSEKEARKEESGVNESTSTGDILRQLRAILYD